MSSLRALSLLLICTLGAALAPQRGFAAEVLFNTDFPENLVDDNGKVLGWMIPNGYDSEWDALNCDEPLFCDQSEESGSAAVWTDQTSLVNGIRQCVAVFPGETLVFGSWIYVPPNQETAGFANVRGTLFRDDNCTVGYLGTSGKTVTNQIRDFDDWQLSAVIDVQDLIAARVPPEPPQSFRFTLQVRNETEGLPFEALFDGVVYFVPEPPTWLLQPAALVVLSALARTRRGRG